jgi:isopenicillin N synthase-like dioxygenase
MAHYPYRTDLSDEFGIAPDTDTSFLTLLAPDEVHSLSIRKPANGSMRRPFPAPLQ